MTNHKVYNEAKNKAVKALLNYATAYYIKFDVPSNVALDAARLVLEKAVVDIE